MKEKETICILPWIQLGVQPDSSLRFCEWSTRSIVDSEERPLLLSENQLNDIVNSQDALSIRATLKDGRFPKSCFRCKNAEDNGARSKRQQELLRYKGQLGKLQKENNHLHLELRASHVCNSGCYICSPELSSYLGREIANKDISLNVLGGRYKKSFDKYKNLNNWVKEERFSEFLNELPDSLTQIYIAGGEPLLIKQYANFLQQIIDRGQQDKVHVKISTNLTIFPEKFLNILIKFPKLSIYCSMDGVGKSYEYNRYPSVWNVFENNFNKLLEVVHEDVEVLVLPTVHILSAWSLKDIYKWSFTIKEKNKKLFSVKLWSILQFPKELSLCNMPYELKQKLRVDIEELMRNTKITAFDCVELKNVLRFMDSQKPINDLFLRGKKIAEEFDRIRNNSWSDVATELKPFW